MGIEDKTCPDCGRRGFPSLKAYAGHVSTHSTKHHQLTLDDRRRAAAVTLAKDVPGRCPRCARRRFRSYSAYLSHLGLHGLAWRLGFGESRHGLRQAAKALADMGFYTTDPVKGFNTASQRGLSHLVSLGKVF